MSVHYFSPSQIETHSKCARKWAFGSLLGMRVPQTKGQALGDEVHKQLENYLQGRPLDYTRESGYIAAAALEHLPKQEDLVHVQVERTFHLGYKDFHLTGRIDWTFTPPGDLVTIGDHKTTSNIVYAKSEADLDSDIQATVYAFEGMSRYQTPKLRLRWGYVQTRKPYVTRPVEIVAESPRVVERMHEITETQLVPMSRLLHLKKPKGLDTDSGHVTKVVQSVEPNASHCDAFGGCPYRSHCTDLSSGERIRSLFMSNAPSSGSSGVSSLLARLGNISKDNPPPPPPPPAPEPPPASDPINPPEEEQAPAPTAAEIEAKETAKKGAKRGKKAAEAPAPALAPATENEGLTLYVNCAPVGSDAELRTAILVAAAKNIVNEQLNVADYRFEGFGKGQGALASAVVALVKEEKPRELFLDSTSSEGAVLLSPLTSLASRVVRGVR